MRTGIAATAAGLVFLAGLFWLSRGAGLLDGAESQGSGDDVQGGDMESDGGVGVIEQAINTATNAVTAPTSLSPQGLAMLGNLEGFSPTAYHDFKGDSIGFGHLIKAGEEYLLTAVITPADAAQLEQADVAWCERAVSAAVGVSLTQQQFDSLCMFCYNIGAPKFKGSTLVKLLNEGDYALAAGQFGRWTKAGGVDNAALIQRRAREQVLFAEGVYA